MSDIDGKLVLPTRLVILAKAANRSPSIRPWITFGGTTDDPHRIECVASQNEGHVQIRSGCAGAPSYRNLYGSFLKHEATLLTCKSAPEWIVSSSASRYSPNRTSFIELSIQEVS
jgi:hypothetical protein